MSVAGALKVAAIIRDSGGEIVGRTRLQKVAYLLTEVGLEDGFDFVYKHYGPFSEDLASAARLGSLLGDLDEIERPTAWGGTYSVFSVQGQSGGTSGPRQSLAKLAASADAVELELAATAVFLRKDGYDDPWTETARRKPEKATPERVEHAKQLLKAFRGVEVPRPLPDLV